MTSHDSERASGARMGTRRSSIVDLATALRFVTRKKGHAAPSLERQVGRSSYTHKATSERLHPAATVASRLMCPLKLRRK